MNPCCCCCLRCTFSKRSRNDIEMALQAYGCESKDTRTKLQDIGLNSGCSGRIWCTRVYFVLGIVCFVSLFYIPVKDQPRLYQLVLFLVSLFFSSFVGMCFCPTPVTSYRLNIAESFGEDMEDDASDMEELPIAPVL